MDENVLGLRKRQNPRVVQYPKDIKQRNHRRKELETILLI